MAIIKRAAKRIAPKTLDKMRAKTAEKERINAEKIRILEAEKEKQRLKRQEEKDWIIKKRDRVKEIEIQRGHLLEQPGYDNPYRRAMLIKYGSEAKNESTINTRGQYSEGTIMHEKKYKELLKRNKKVLDKKTKDYEASNLLLISTEQLRSLSRANLLGFDNYHEKVVNYILKKYQKGKIDYNTALDLMKKVNFSVKSAISQGTTIHRKYPNYREMHARVVGKVLVDFLKRRDYPEMQRTLNSISLSLKENRGVFKTLNELDGYYKK
jgi:hypothetical protein